MRFGSPIFRKYWWGAFLSAAIAVFFLDLVLPRGTAHLWLPTIAALAVALFVSFLAAGWGSGSLTNRISRLTAFADTLVQPQPVTAASPLGGDEIGALDQVVRKAATQWQQMADQLQLESARREAILKSIAEGVLAVDKDLRVIFCNDSLARLLGVRSPISPRLSLLDMARDPDLTQVLNQTLSSRTPFKRTLQLAAADGRVFEVNARPLATTSNNEGAIAIFHDITELERLERVRKDFVANVSHELRTPLTAIRGYAETLLDGAVEDPKAQRQFLSVILAHAIRLNNIASDLLILSELDSGKRLPEPERISVRAAIETAIHTVEPEAQLRDVRLVTDKLESACVWGTRLRLEQALINLIDNAVKFNRAGGSVRIESGAAAAGQVYISIRDDGIGIPSEDLPRIFERFYRVDKARSREVGGTGLGLSIVKHVVERMNGTVSVESQLNQGSTFTIVLPRCPLPA
jgi:two-component system, OmpR family, phosphate regulon sensor histidine kinase PhoR